MDTEYASMFDNELDKDSLREGKLNIRNEFLRKVYLFFYLNLIIIAKLGLISYFFFNSNLTYVNWIFIFFSLLFQIYFQIYGQIQQDECRKIMSFTIGSLSIITNGISYQYLIGLMDFEISYGYDQYEYDSYLVAFAQLFIVVYILMFIVNASEYQLRSHEAWIVALIVPYFLQFIYNFCYLNLEVIFDRVLLFPAVITWLEVIIVMMTQEIQAQHENYEAIFINSCRLTGVFFQVFIYAGQFIFSSHRNDNLVVESNEIQKLQHLRKMSTILSIITIVILMIQMSFMSELQNMNIYAIVWPQLPASLINIDFSFTAFFWVCFGLSLLFYALTLIVKRYHWIISWTLAILQIIFYTLVLLGLSWRMAIVNTNLYLINVAFCTLNGICVGLVAYTFVEKNQFQLSKAFLYMSICPFLIYIAQIYPIYSYEFSYANSTYVFIGFEIYVFLYYQSFISIQTMGFQILSFKIMEQGLCQPTNPFLQFQQDPSVYVLHAKTNEYNIEQQLFNQYINYMTSQFMELFEMQKSYQDTKEDTNIEQHIFIRKIFLFTFTEYYVTFLASFSLVLLHSRISFFCFLTLSLAFQIYFEFQGQIQDESLRSTLNYIFGGLSIISNLFSNFFIWNFFCYKYWDVDFIVLNVLFIGQILLVLFIFMFYSNISKVNYNNKAIWLIPTMIPLFLQFISNFFYYGDDYLFQTIIATWLLIMIVMMTKEMKQKQNTYDEIFIHSCRLLGIPFQILVYIGKFFTTSHESKDYLFQGTSKEKVAYLRKVAVTFFTISFFLLVFSAQLDICHYGSFCDHLIDYENNALQFKTLFWVSLGLCIVSYFVILFGHNFMHWIFNWIIFLIQVVFFSFIVFGIGWFGMIQHSLPNYFENLPNYNLYEAAYCSLGGLSIGLLIYTLNMADNLYNKSSAIFYMMICPICIWISQIYSFALLDVTFIGYSFSILLFYLAFSIWIAFELEWQLNVKTFELKQQDYHIGAIQIFEPGLSIISRLIGLFM